MKKSKLLAPLFKQFIRDTETGKRLKKNGEKILPQTIDNYKFVLHNLVKFQTHKQIELRICDASKLNAREYKTEKNYWKKFYKNFTDFLYKKGCRDNYVGTNIKIIRTFFNYLKNDLDYHTGDFQRLFYVRNEHIEILVLSIEQLKFLIHDESFQLQLSKKLLRTKDVFLFGCATGLRFSDIMKLTSKNITKQGESYYLKIKSQKTKVFSFIKLPTYAIEIVKRNISKSSKEPLFRNISLYNFNKNLKELGKAAKFVQPIEVSREVRGAAKRVSKKEVLFYQKMTSHMMRRTAITSHLMLGMPEHLVKKISGHSGNSPSFNRYVHYAQTYVDNEIDKVHQKMEVL